MAAAPAVTSVVNYAAMRELGFPVSGAGANIPVGTLMMPGASAGTNLGVLIPVTSSSNALVIGCLNGAHNYAASGDALTATLTQWFNIPSFDSNSYLLGNKLTGGGPFPSHPIDLIDTMVAAKVSYSQASTVAVASQSTTTVTVTSAVTGEDSAFLYVNTGTGSGQLMFVTQSNSGSFTVAAAPTVSLDTTSKLTKILPLFVNLVIWKVNTTTFPTLLDSTAGQGSGRASVLANFISINGLVSRLDPKIFSNAQALTSVGQLDFYSYLGLVNTSFHPIA